MHRWSGHGPSAIRWASWESPVFPSGFGTAGSAFCSCLRQATEMIFVETSM